MEDEPARRHGQCSRSLLFDHQHADANASGLHHHLQHLIEHRFAETSGGLVEQQVSGFDDQRPGQRPAP